MLILSHWCNTMHAFATLLLEIMHVLLLLWNTKGSVIYTQSDTTCFCTLYLIILMPIKKVWLWEGEMDRLRQWERGNEADVDRQYIRPSHWTQKCNYLLRISQNDTGPSSSQHLISSAPLSRAARSHHYQFGVNSLSNNWPTLNSIWNVFGTVSKATLICNSAQDQHWLLFLIFVQP